MRICCIVKPAALKHADAIASALEEAGIPILAQKHIVYTIPFIDVLYDHMSPAARFAIGLRMAGAPGIAFLVEALSVDAFLEIAGRESDPSKCAPHSIRARFAKGAEEERVSDWVWFENAFHRPVDEREAHRDVSLVFPEMLTAITHKRGP